jgi:hypothetical protein
MKPLTPNAVVLSVRCAHRSSAGRRCRLSVSDPRSVFCAQHRSEQLEEQAADHFLHLSHNYQSFQTAQGINHALHNLYQLLAQNRISARRAAVLSHICGLLLRTLPQIDADNAAGIEFPPKNVNVANPDLALVPHAALDLDSGSHSGADPDSASDSKTNADSSNPWDASLPEPDPNKKPS